MLLLGPWNQNGAEETRGYWGCKASDVHAAQVSRVLHRYTKDMATNQNERNDETNESLNLRDERGLKERDVAINKKHTTSKEQE